MFWRIRCHFCQARQPHSKTIREFQCQQCEAYNYLDGQGNIIDTPYDRTMSTALEKAGREKSSFQYKADSSRLAHQKEQAFCQTCLQNQHIFNEMLANYLPDEDHPQYRQFERDLPQFKRDLEQRYPLICTNCAPKAQHVINRADFNALADNANIRCAETRARRGRSPRGRRDSWGKFVMRLLLDVVGWVMTAGVWAQTTWHGYAILVILLTEPGTLAYRDGVMDVERTGHLNLAECVQSISALKLDPSCYQLFGKTLVPHTLMLAVAFLWYNPGLKKWFDPTFRMETVDGQWNYFYIQLISLVLRALAWSNLKDLSDITFTNRDQLLATHGFMTLFPIISERLAARHITATRWRIKGHVMPKPEDQDVLGIGAGPAKEHFTPKASESDPWKLLRSTGRAVNSEMLLKRTQQSKTISPAYPQLVLSEGGPTPEASLHGSSDHDFDDDDEMDLDSPYSSTFGKKKLSQPRLSPSHIYFPNRARPPLDLPSLSSEIDNIDRSIAASDSHARTLATSKHTYAPRNDLTAKHRPANSAPNFNLPPPRPFTAPPERPDYISKPFQGKLPQAPMSIGRRLRNPPVQPEPPKKVHPTEKPDWFAGLAKESRGKQAVRLSGPGTEAQMKRSEWVLPQDVKTLGLEDRFAGVFSLNDQAAEGDGQKKTWYSGLLG